MLKHRSTTRGSAAVVLALHALAGLAFGQDECSTATMITVGSTLTYNTAGATPSPEVWWCDPNPLGDIWFRYDATATATVRAETCGTLCQMEVYRGPCASRTWLGCDEGRCAYIFAGPGSAVPFYAEAGASYYIRLVARYPGSPFTVSGALSLRPHVAPAHDECTGAVPIGIGTPATIDAFDATMSANPAACAIEATGDVWYSFTPTVTGSYMASTCDGQPGMHMVEVLSGPCGALSSLGCNESFCSNFDGATQRFVGTAGSTYFIRTYQTYPFPTTGQLVVEPEVVATNDECTQALPIALGQVVPFNTLNATASPMAWTCMGSGGRDLWYRFTPPRSGRYVAEDVVFPFDALLEVFDGTCGALNPLTCGTVPPGYASGRIEFAGTAGVDVWLRLGGWLGGVVNGEFRLVEVLANDDCAGAAVINAGTPTVVELALATPSSNPWACDLAPAGGSPVKDVWFRFTANVTGSYVVRTCGTAPQIPFVQVLAGNCNATTSLDCRYDFDCTQTFARFTAIQGSPVLVRFGIASSVPAPALIEVTNDPRPGNDECSNAAPIGLGSTPYDLTFATRSGTPNLWCGSVAIDHDVFYTFQAATNGPHRVRSCGSTPLALEVFEGGCSPAWPFWCGIGACPAIGGWTLGATVFFDAVAGQIYTIRLGCPEGLIGGMGILELSTQAPPANDLCTTPTPVVAGANPFDSSFATTQGGSFQCSFDAGSDIWFRYVATTTGQTDFTLCGTFFSSIIEVRPDGGCGAGAVLACNQAATVCPSPNVTSSAVGVQVTAGTAYLIRVGSFNRVTGPGVLNVHEGIDPQDSGTAYCTAVVNSTGQPAQLRGVGSTALLGSFALRTTQLPVGSFGYYLVSRQQGLTQNPGGSQGTLCLSGVLGRYIGPGQVGAANALGTFQLPISVFWMPQPNGPVASNRGETWNWQFWFRDQLGGQATSNFSNGLAGVIQ